IYFSVGPQYISTATLQVSANSRADIVFNPGQITFGVVPQGKPTQPRSLDVEYAGRLDWKIKEIETNSHPLTAEFKELYRKAGQVGYQVKVAVKPEAPPGAWKYELFLKTNDPASPLVPVLVEATVQASLSVSPSELNLGKLKVGTLETRRVSIRAEKPF